MRQAMAFPHGIGLKAFHLVSSSDLSPRYRLSLPSLVTFLQPSVGYVNTRRRLTLNGNRNAPLVPVVWPYWTFSQNLPPDFGRHERGLSPGNTWSLPVEYSIHGMEFIK